MGLNPHAVKPKNLEEAIQHRMGEHGIRNRSRYLAILRCSRQERLNLVESVALPAVGFFQHPDPLAALQRWVTNHWLARPSKKPLRVLSVPCATGEEPYSLAITLLESGLSPTQFHIDAADINDRALRHAAAAMYADASLTNANQVIRDRYFQREQSGHRLCPGVRAQVSFIKTDLVGRMTLSETYDIIFGRSLLMYFVPEAQQRILKRLEKLLRPGGLLIVGPTHGKLGHQSSLPVWANSGGTAGPGGVKSLGNSSRDGKINGEDRATLREAAALVEAHRLQEAAELCVRVLDDHRASAQAIYLLGRIAEVEGRHVEAKEFFRRALYLQPRHRLAQEHLKHLGGKRGT